MRIRRSLSTVALLAAILAQAVTPICALAAGQSRESLAVVRAWSRSTAPGASVGVAYFEIVNAGAADTLVRIECPLAQRVEMHSTAIIDGMMQMRPTPTVEIPAGGRVVFKPGGLHAMLIELKAPLEEGRRVPLTLVFRHAGSVRIEAIIQGLGTTSAPAESDFDGQHHD
jgi:copper(I)-binding protein